MQVQQSRQAAQLQARAVAQSTVLQPAVFLKLQGSMAHFAELIDGIVARVIVVSNVDTASNGVEDEAIGAAFCHNLLGGEWLQTSYNGNMRFNYAGIGYTYDTVRNAFIAPKPFASWVLDEATCRWTAPVPKPSAGGLWVWDEATLGWIAV